MERKTERGRNRGGEREKERERQTKKGRETDGERGRERNRERGRERERKIEKVWSDLEMSLFFKENHFLPLKTSFYVSAAENSYAGERSYKTGLPLSHKLEELS